MYIYFYLFYKQSSQNVFHQLIQSKPVSVDDVN
jgi:hypothetical protein